MSDLVCACCLVVSVGCWPSRRQQARVRLAAISSSGSAAPSPGEEPKPWLLPVAAIAGGLVASWSLGVVGLVGSLVVIAIALTRRNRRPQDPATISDAALLADLMSGCLLAGASLPAALRISAAALTGELCVSAQRVAAELQAGLTPSLVWEPWTADPQLAGIARVCSRVASTGAGSAVELRRLADRLRAQRRAAIESAAARAGVWLVLPLGLCFLPAFVALTVVPVVAGLRLSAF